MGSIVNRPISTLDDIKRILGFWELCALGHKEASDYKITDHLILKSLAYLEAS